jgi:type I restriction enzyme R subunit
VEEHKEDPVIYKLNHNLPLSKADYEELERILTQELGDSDDYKREYGDTPFGLLVRKIAKLDHESAMLAFSTFINDESLNQRQIEFILKIINHIESNGYIEDVKILMKPPFDKPYSFIKMFDQKTRTALIQTIEAIKNNALNVVA